MLQLARRNIYPLVSSMMAKATLVEGPLKGSGLPFRGLFVHNCLFNAELRKRTFAEEPRVIWEKRLFLPALNWYLRSHAADYDLCIAVLPSFYENQFKARADFMGQEEVRHVIDAGIGWDEMRLRFSHKKRQVTNKFEEKHGLSYRISNELADFDLFYHQMYEPLIRKRYGDLADVDPYAVAKAWFDQGFVLFVEKDGQPVAGALSELQDGVILFRRSGVLGGDESHVKAGAQTALYFFQLRYAADRGLKAVDALKTAPFLNDGVFKHKVDWGAETQPDDETQRSVFYFLNGRTESQAAFFEVNPIVIRSDQGMAALVGRRVAAEPAPKKGASHDIQQYKVLGVQQVLTVDWPAQPDLTATPMAPA